MAGPRRFNSERVRQANNQGGRDTDLDICSDPAFATHLSDPLAEPVVVSQFWKGRRRDECVRVTLSRYQGKPILDVRVFFTTKTGHMQASKKGIAFAISRLPLLRKALEKAETKALDLDLLEAVS
jgi:hypothetical protein